MLFEQAIFVCALFCICHTLSVLPNYLYPGVFDAEVVCKLCGVDRWDGNMTDFELLLTSKDLDDEQL